MRALRILACLLGLGLFVPGLFAAEAELKVIGPAGETHYSMTALAALPQSECTVTEAHSKEQARFTGVAVRELLTRAGMPTGEAMRGKFLRQAVLVRCADGYAVVFTLADFDPAFSSQTILLALQRNGAPLSEKSGPFQLIVPADKQPARRARLVASIEIISVGDSATTSPAHP